MNVLLLECPRATLLVLESLLSKYIPWVGSWHIFEVCSAAPLENDNVPSQDSTTRGGSLQMSVPR